MAILPAFCYRGSLVNIIVLVGIHIIIFQLLIYCLFITIMFVFSTIQLRWYIIIIIIIFPYASVHLHLNIRNFWGTTFSSYYQTQFRNMILTHAQVSYRTIAPRTNLRLSIVYHSKQTNIQFHTSRGKSSYGWKVNKSHPIYS